ncbi:flagellar biosynthesis protein FlaG [Clostridium sp. Cult3]|nr:flagellar biosynthesis protein FlaG [Clostridium sp. Cult3]
MRIVGKDRNVNPIKTLEERRCTEDELIQNIESANEKFVAYDRRFEFSIHEKTKQIMVKVIDVTTDETIREIPPEKILDLVAAIWEISGIIVDERV